MARDEYKTVRCSFCGKHQEQVERIIAGPGAYICNECVHLCLSILDEEERPELGSPEMPDVIPTPREIRDVLSARSRRKSPCPWLCTTTISGFILVAGTRWSCKRATSSW